MLSETPLNHHTNLPFRAREFEFVVCMLPPSTPNAVHDASGSIVGIEELSRVCNPTGFIMIGMPARSWESKGVMDELEHSTAAQLLAVQSIDCSKDFDDAYFLALLRK